VEGAGRIDVLAGRYRLDHLLGRGGMGAVWAGHDTVLNRPVAVKMLRDDLGPDTPRQRERLLAEARAAAAVRHPNLVSTFDAVTDDGTFALVMERLPGPSLADRLADGPLTTAEARTVALDVLGGLDAVHDAGLVHRDVKPANVLRSADGRWMLVDFGVAKNLLAGDHLTATGTTVGTPAYLAPEQLLGRPATPSADLWAVGVMLYEALSGRLPFSGDTAFAIAYSVQTDSPEPLSTVLPDADPAISGTVERALRKPTEDRFDSASAMAASLRPGSAGGIAPAAAPARPGLATVIDGGQEPEPSRSRALALPLVAASLILAVVLAVTLGGGADEDDTARPTATSEGQGDPGDGKGAPTTAGSPSDAATATPSSTATRPTGSRRSATAPGGSAADDPSATTTSSAGTPTTEGSGTTPTTSAPPETTTSTTTSTTTTTSPVSVPEVTLPELPVDVKIALTPPGLGAITLSVPATPG
jgi:non-specific serine/threonine protein kinase/serine/threonine-protein kinase